MKRVQRANGSLAQSGARPQCGFHIQPPTDSPRKTWQSQCACAKTHSHSAADFVPSSPRRLRVLSVSSVLRRDRHKETHKPEVNQPSPITARQPENARPTAEQERNIPQAVLFGAHAANSRRDRTRAFQVSVVPERPSPRETHPHCESNEESPESRWLFGAGLGARSPQRTPRGKHGKANVITQKRTHAAPPTSFPRPLVVSAFSPSPPFSVGIAARKRANPK